MRREGRALVVLMAGALIALAFVTAVRADHAPLWSSADGGGGTVAAGSYVLTSAIGQTDAGTLNGLGGYVLVGGVLAAGSGGAVTQDERVFLPGVFR